MRGVRRFGSDTRGANFAEYLILVAVVAMIGFAGFRVFGEVVQDRAECLGGRILGGGASCGEGESSKTGSASSALDRSSNPKYGKISGGEGSTYAPVQGEAYITGKGDPTAIHPNDISQGQIGDCYVMSAMAAISARDPNAIQNIIQQNADGTYTVTFRERTSRPWWQFWGSDGWKEVKITVKPEFPTKDGQPVFAQPGDRSGDNAELWPMILEKAYAQYKGSYDAIGQGGWAGDPMQAMTGNESEHIGQGVSIETLAEKWQNDYALVASSLADSDAKNNEYYGEKSPLGTPLVSGHAYFVTNVDANARTVTLKNPWGWDSGTFTVTIDQYNQLFRRTAATPVSD